jgi:Protein-tyrosine-phosphatase
MKNNTAVLEHGEKTADSDINQICFVCTGNTCRSPMAEALFNHFNSDANRKAVSAGIAAYDSPISKNARTALINRGIPSTKDNDYDNHRARRINEKIIAESSQIIAMTINHSLTLISMYPEYASKIFTMPSSISDPYGLSLKVYEDCLSEIKACLMTLFNFPEAEQNGDGA